MIRPYVLYNINKNTICSVNSMPRSRLFEIKTIKKKKKTVSLVNSEKIHRIQGIQLITH